MVRGGEGRGGDEGNELEMNPSKRGLLTTADTRLTQATSNSFVEIWITRRASSSRIAIYLEVKGVVKVMQLAHVQ